MDQSTMNDMMATYTGLRFCPMDMKPENVRLEDIAHALSLLCRGGGHLKYFYSVGSTASTARRRPLPGDGQSVWCWPAFFMMPVRLTFQILSVR